jgi:hypothetical protein
MVTFQVTGDEKLPEGEYLFKLKSVAPDTEPSKFDNGKPRNKWIFEVAKVVSLDDENEDETGLVGQDVWQWTTDSMKANSTQYAWLCGMTGRKSIDKSDVIDSNDLIGQLFKVTWGNKHYTIQQTGESGTKVTILTIKPHKPKATRPAVEPDEDEDF